MPRQPARKPKGTLSRDFTDRLAEHGASDRLLSGDTAAAPAGRRFSRRQRLSVAALAVLILVGGGVFAGRNQIRDLAGAVNGGRGPQPASVLAGGALTYTAFDLDPAFGQQRLLARLKDGLSTLGFTASSSGALVTRLATATLTDDPTSWPAWDTSWAGNRMLAAAYPADTRTSSGGGRQVLAVRVDADQHAAATNALTALKAGLRGAMAWKFTGEYVVIGSTDATVTALTTFAAGKSLADDQGVTADLDKAGDTRVLTGWADLPKVAATYPNGISLWAQVPFLTQAFYGKFGAHGEGRVAVAGFAEDDTLRVNLWSSALAAGGTTTASAAGGSQASLLRYAPAGSTFAATVKGGASVLIDQWDDIAKQDPYGLVSQVNTLGLELPGALAAVAGNETLYATTGATVDGRAWVLRSRTPDPYTAMQTGKNLAQTLLPSLSPNTQPVARPVDGGVVIATSSELADAASGTGDAQTLGKQDTFGRVLPDVDSADAAFYWTTASGGKRVIVGAQMLTGGTVVVRVAFPDAVIADGASPAVTTPEVPSSGADATDAPADGTGTLVVPFGDLPIVRTTTPAFVDDAKQLLANGQAASRLITDRDALTASWPKEYREPLHAQALALQALLDADFKSTFTNDPDPTANRQFYVNVMGYITRYSDQVAVISWWLQHEKSWGSDTYWASVAEKVANGVAEGKDTLAQDAAATALRKSGPAAVTALRPALLNLAQASPQAKQGREVQIAAQAVINAPVSGLADVIKAAVTIDTFMGVQR